METQDRKIEELFNAARLEVSDKGFTEQVKQKLPRRRSFLPRIIILVSFWLGAVFCFLVSGNPVSYIAELLSASDHEILLSLSAILIVISGSVAYAFYEIEKV